MNRHFARGIIRHLGRGLAVGLCAFGLLAAAVPAPPEDDPGLFICLVCWQGGPHCEYNDEHKTWPGLINSHQGGDYHECQGPAWCHQHGHADYIFGVEAAPKKSEGLDEVRRFLAAYHAGQTDGMNAVLRESKLLFVNASRNAIQAITPAGVVFAHLPMPADVVGGLAD